MRQTKLLDIITVRCHKSFTFGDDTTYSPAETSLAYESHASIYSVSSLRQFDLAVTRVIVVVDSEFHC